MHTGQLQQLLAQDSGRGQQIRAEQQAIATLQAQLIEAEQQQANAGRLFKEALLAGRDDPLYREAVEESRLESELKRAALSGAQHRLAGLRHEVDTQEFDAAVATLFDAFASGSDTPEQRQALNRLMRRAGLEITLDNEAKRVGMAIGDGPIEWQPLDPKAVQAALAHRTSSATFRDMTITAESAAAMAALDPDDPGWAEWLQSMVGVKQTSVTSLPPGWEKSQIAKALKAFRKDTKKNAPELHEALKLLDEQASG